MSRAAFRRLYRSVPDVSCKGLCQESCGPIAMTRWEADRIEARTGEAVGVVDPDSLRCPLLTDDGRCSVYDIRPLICRLYGAVDARLMRCPHGCRPERLLTREESHELMEQAEVAGGDAVLTVPGPAGW